MIDPTLIELPDELVGERVLVRPYRSGDGRAMQEAIESSREFLRPWMIFWDQHRTVEESEALIRKFTAKWILREDLPMGMWLLENGRYLGGTGIHRIDWNLRRFEIGYWIRSDAQGRGYVTETVRLLSRLAFETLKANRLIIRCATCNEKSRAIPERLEFVHEGIARCDIMRPNGEILDSHVYTLTPKDWARLADPEKFARPG